MIRYEQAWTAKSDSLMTTEEALAQLFAEEIAKENPFQEIVFDCKSTNENHAISFCIHYTELGFSIDLQLKNKGSDVTELQNIVGTVYDPLPSSFQKLAAILDYLEVNEIKHRYTNEGFPRDFVVAPSKPFKSQSK
jgi:hypothetical protein